MKLQQFQYRCGTCGNWYFSPELTWGYGEFVLVSKTGELRYLNAIGDQVFSEVEGILMCHSRYLLMNEANRATFLQRIYGFACDPDELGDRFLIGAQPACPQCKEVNVSAFQSVEPPEFLDIDVLPVTHLEWNALCSSSKEILVGRVAQAWLGTSG